MRRHRRWAVPAVALAALPVLAGTAALAVAPIPERVVLEGEFRIERATPDDCFVSVPPLLSGTIYLGVDYRSGEVTGHLEGSGSGDDRVPGGCRSSGSAAVYRAALQFSGDIRGIADPTTGRFDATATLDVTGEGFYTVPGSQLSCAASPGLQDECPLASIISPQTAEVAGTLTAEEPFGGTIDWYTDYCLAVSGSGVSYTREGCPTRGTWTTQALEIILPANRDPVITDVTVEPAAPREGGPVVLTAVAHDPDGDTLTFHWTVDGAVLASTAAEARWSDAAAGDYWVELLVVDDREGQARTSLGFTVTAVAPSTSEATETSTTSLGADPLAAPDEEAAEADTQAATADDLPWGWEPSSSRIPQGLGLVVFLFAVLAGVFSGSLLVGYLVRLRMGWSRQEAAEDAVRAEGLEVPTDDFPLSWSDVLREGQYQQQGGRRPVPGWLPPGSRQPPPGPPGPPRERAYPEFSHRTPGTYHEGRSGLKPGSYRCVEFTEPVYLEKPSSDGGVELITSQFTKGLIGEPDPAFPGHSPAYRRDGTVLGWVRTADLPG